MGAPLRYVVFRAFAQGLLDLYYRSIEVYGRHLVPKNGRTLLIANHQAGLVDGLVIVGSTPLVIRTLAKNTLWDNPVIGVFATALGMIPVYRKQDVSAVDAAKSSADRNATMFNAVSAAFDQGQVVLLFPEGKSHDISHMQKLRSGAARMLLQNEGEHDFRLGLKWLPIALDCEKKDQPGSRIVVHYHPPRDVQKYRELYARDPEAAVEQLRAEMEDYLRDVTVNFATWDDRVFIERLTEIWLARSPAEKWLDRHNQLLKWKRIMDSNETEDQLLWAQLRESVSKLYASLTLLGLSPADIYRRSTPAWRRVAARVLVRVFIWAPVMAFGLAYWWLPTQLILAVTRKGATSKDVVASYQLVAGIIAYPLWSLLTLPWVAGFLGAEVGLGMALLTIASGIAILTVSRRLAPQLREVIALYRHGNMGNFVVSTDEKIQSIWTQAARLWNRGLRRQVLIEDLEAPSTEKPAA